MEEALREHFDQIAARAKDDAGRELAEKKRDLAEDFASRGFSGGIVVSAMQNAAIECVRQQINRTKTEVREAADSMYGGKLPVEVANEVKDYLLGRSIASRRRSFDTWRQ
jgi:hypothetical protein